MSHTDKILRAAKAGDIEAFHQLFQPFKQPLSGFLYRLTASRIDTEDLYQETFIKGFNNISKFRATGSLKNWIFKIAANLAYDWLKGQKRWKQSVLDDLKQYAETHPDFRASLLQTNQCSPQGAYEIKEHINFCFSCIGKTLPLRQQLVLLLKDMLGFKLAEISDIIEESVPNVKWLLREARQSMRSIFDNNCALVNKKGTCYQCSALNGLFNPKLAAQMTLLEKRAKEGATSKKLLKIRTQIAKSIQPFSAHGFDLHELIFQQAHQLSKSTKLLDG